MGHFLTVFRKQKPQPTASCVAWCDWNVCLKRTWSTYDISIAKLKFCIIPWTWSRPWNYGLLKYLLFGDYICWNLHSWSKTFFLLKDMLFLNRQLILKDVSCILKVTIKSINRDPHGISYLFIHSSFLSTISSFLSF